MPEEERKIIREFVEGKKEVEPEEEIDEDEDEGKVSQESEGKSARKPGLSGEEVEPELIEERGGEFIPSEAPERTAPILQITEPAAMPIPEELEDTAATAPSTPTPTTPTPGTKETEPTDYIADYDARRYTPQPAVGERAIVREEMEQKGMFMRPQEIREIRPKEEIEEWHEIERARTRAAGVEEPVLPTERHKEEGKLPFEEKRKYREKRL